MTRKLVSTVIALVVMSIGAPARAEYQLNIYEKVDERGVRHLLMYRPPGLEGKLWKPMFNFPEPTWQKSGPKIKRSKDKKCRDVRPARDRSPERYHRYDTFIAKAIANFRAVLPEPQQFPLQEAFIRAIIKRESDYDPEVLSCVGAKGLVQIMPDEEHPYRIDKVFDPEQNILGGAAMLRYKMDRITGNSKLMAEADRLTRINGWPNRLWGVLALTAASHHAGYGAVSRRGGIPQNGQTPYYVRKVMEAYRTYVAAPAIAGIE